MAGVAGAKLWYIAVHRGRRFDGWCIQGFIAGAAAATAAAVPFGALRIPVGTFFDTAVPRLLVGMAIGRPGCFWAGCCTGRPTKSRWCLWSSDRRVGTRRVPAQLLEALLCLAIGLAALLTALVTGPGSPGTLAAAVTAYTLGRQFILGLRADPPRRSPWSGPITTVVAATVLAAAIIVAVIV